MKNFRDIEQLSLYLDGQLNSSDSKRLESRLTSDPELVSALNDIRAARGILRKLPARKAFHTSLQFGIVKYERARMARCVISSARKKRSLTSCQIVTGLPG